MRQIRQQNQQAPQPPEEELQISKSNKDKGRNDRKRKAATVLRTVKNSRNNEDVEVDNNSAIQQQQFQKVPEIVPAIIELLSTSDSEGEMEQQQATEEENSDNDVVDPEYHQEELQEEDREEHEGERWEEESEGEGEPQQDDGDVDGGEDVHDEEEEEVGEGEDEESDEVVDQQQEDDGEERMEEGEQEQERSDEEGDDEAEEDAAPQQVVEADPDSGEEEEKEEEDDPPEEDGRENREEGECGAGERNSGSVVEAEEADRLDAQQVAENKKVQNAALKELLGKSVRQVKIFLWQLLENIKIYSGTYRNLTQEHVDHIRREIDKRFKGDSSNNEMFQEGISALIDEADMVTVDEDENFGIRVPNTLAVLEGTHRMFVLLSQLEDFKKRNALPQFIQLTLYPLPSEAFNETISHMSVMFDPKKEEEDERCAKLENLHAATGITDPTICRLLSYVFEKYQADASGKLFPLHQQCMAWRYWAIGEFGEAPPGGGLPTHVTFNSVRRAIQNRCNYEKTIDQKNLKSFVFCYYAHPVVRDKIMELYCENFVLHGTGDLAWRVCNLSARVEDPTELVALLEVFHRSALTYAQCAAALSLIDSRLQKEEVARREEILKFTKSDFKTPTEQKKFARAKKLEYDKKKAMLGRMEQKAAKMAAAEALKQEKKKRRPSAASVLALSQQLEQQMPKREGEECDDDQNNNPSAESQDDTAVVTKTIKRTAKMAQDPGEDASGISADAEEKGGKKKKTKAGATTTKKKEEDENIVNLAVLKETDLEKASLPNPMTYGASRLRKLLKKEPGPSNIVIVSLAQVLNDDFEEYDGVNKKVQRLVETYHGHILIVGALPCGLDLMPLSKKLLDPGFVYSEKNGISLKFGRFKSGFPQKDRVVIELLNLEDADTGRVHSIFHLGKSNLEKCLEDNSKKYTETTSIFYLDLSPSPVEIAVSPTSNVITC